jgi:ABC-2 type transport system permease protein
MHADRTWVRLSALVAHEALLLSRQPGPLIVYTVLPLLLMVVLQPMLGAVAETSGGFIGSGASQATAGMAVMFSLFALKTVGASLLDERTWHTWDRLQSSPAAFWEILAGKALPLLGALVLQQTILFAFAFTALGLQPPQSWWPLVAAIITWSICVLLLGTTASIIIRSPAQLSAVGDIIAMLASIVGGALVPAALLPEWLRGISPLLPSFWALRGYQLALAGASVSTLAQPLMVLAVVGPIAAVLALMLGRRQAS